MGLNIRLMKCRTFIALGATALLLAPATVQAQPILGPEAEFARVAAQARAAFSAGRYRDALMLTREAQAFAAAELGADHVLTLRALNDIAVIHQLQGDLAAALPLALSAAGGLERSAGPDHPETLNALANLAQLHVVSGNAAEAEPLLRRVHQTRARTLGAEHEATLNALLELAVFLKKQGRLGDISGLLERGAETARSAFGAESAIALDLTAAAAEAKGLPVDANGAG